MIILWVLVIGSTCYNNYILRKENKKIRDITEQNTKKDDGNHLLFNEIFRNSTVNAFENNNEDKQGRNQQNFFKFSSQNKIN